MCLRSPKTQTLFCTLQPRDIFADEVQLVLHKLESHKQANKPVNVHVSVQKDTKPDKRSSYKP